MLRSLLRANLAYAVGSAAISVASLLLVPFLVNALSLQEYGAWALFEVIILLLTMLILAGLDVGLMREYWFLEDSAQRARLAGTILIAVTMWGAVIVGAGSLLLTTQLKLSLPDAPYDWVLVLAIAWLEAVFALLLTVFRIQEKALVFVVLSLGRMALFLGLAVGLVQAGYGLTGALAGRFLAAVLGICAAGLFSARFITLSFDRRALRKAVRYGLPLLPANLAAYILFASDRFVLERFSTLQQVAIYSFAYKVATMVDVLVTRPFAADWAPRRFKIATTANASRRYAQILVLYLFAAVGFALLVLAVTPTIYAWLAPPVYQTGMDVVPVILFAYLIYGLSYPLNIGIMLKDRTRHLPVIGWLAAGVCLALNFAWIPPYGMSGAAWATVVAYAVWTGGIAWSSLRLYPIPYSWRQVGWVIMAGVMGYAGLRIADARLGTANNILAVILKIAWVMVAMGVSGYRLWRGVQHNKQKQQIPEGLPS
jgi:O-antigen/teichoic acid export membrane protein